MSKQLGAIKATLGAFFGKDLGYYPRRDVPDEKIEARELIEKIHSEVSQLKFETKEDAKYHLDVIKESYKEVKLATEYQDEKTSRLLTILAFLTAAGGAVFSKVLDIYPLHTSALNSWQVIIIFFVYAFFGLYLLLVSIGALISFHAMQTRFLAPKDPDTVSEKLKSLLFFKFIYVTDPKTWGKQFLMPPKDLLTEYVRHYVTETYLIAAKTSDKVRYLEPAQNILQMAIKVLVLWILSLAFAVSFVPHDNSKISLSSDERVAPSKTVVGASSSPTPHPKLLETRPASADVKTIPTKQ